MALESNKLTIGYAPGAYDLFHIGHLNLLRRAKTQCDYLIAGVVSDEMLLLKKGITPVVPLSERLEIVRNICFVDQAVAETVPDKLEMWKQLHFDILFKGDDWRGTRKGDQLEKCFAKHNVKVVYFPYTHLTSSSLLRQSLAKLDSCSQKTEQDEAVKKQIKKRLPFYKATSLFFLKPRFQKVLRPFTKALSTAGVTANQVTIIGIVGSILISAILLYFNHHPAVFYLLPLWLLVRMGFNTVDGLLAIEFGQKSRLGGILDEGGDMLSDLLLAVPVALTNPVNQKAFFLLMVLSIVSELAGIAGFWFGSERCHLGPFGKTDRAIAFGCVAIWLAHFGSLPMSMPYLVTVFIGLHAITIFNRVHYVYCVRK